METYTGYEYKLRAGSPMKTANSETDLHSFMAERSEVIIKQAITSSEMLSSDDFLANGGEYVSANYNRYKEKTGDKFNGREVKAPDYIDEDDIVGYVPGGGDKDG